MVAVNKVIFSTERITECYQASKRLFGDEYKEKTKGIRDAMQDLKDQTGRSTVAAGIALLEFMEARNKMDSMLIMLVSAVMYDMAEESEGIS